MSRRTARRSSPRRRCRGCSQLRLGDRADSRRRQDRHTCSPGRSPAMSRIRSTLPSRSKVSPKATSSTRRPPLPSRTEEPHAADRLSLLWRASRAEFVTAARRTSPARRNPAGKAQGWAQFLYRRHNTHGVHAERWRHTRGCGRFFNACVTRPRITSWPPTRPESRARRVRGRIRACAAAAAHRPRAGRCDFTLRRRDYRACRRHARLGAAGQRRAPGRPLLQVSPAARHPRRRRRGAERAGHRAPRRARARPRTCAPRRSSSTRAWSATARTAGPASPSMSARSTTCCRRSFRPASTTRPSCGRARAWHALYEPRIRAAAGLGRAPTQRRSRPLRHALRPLRRAGRRRRARRACRGAERRRGPARASSCATSRPSSAARCCPSRGRSTARRR